MQKRETETEDLAIQETLLMGTHERIELLANLIVDKITEDQQNGQRLLKRIMEAQSA